MNFKPAFMAYINDKGIKKKDFCEGIINVAQLSHYLSGTTPTIQTLNKIYEKYPDFKSYMDKDYSNDQQTMTDILKEQRELLIEQRDLLKKLLEKNQ